MSDRGFQIKDQYAVHFLTFTVVEWVDVFTRKIYSDILIDSLKFCQEKKGLKIHAWCIMSNHVHLILSTDGVKKLSDVIRDFKKFSSFAIINAIQNNTKELEKNGCYGFLGKQVNLIVEMKIINFGSRLIIQ
jgi:REP element-mobilizing transposase RayT